MNEMVFVRSKGRTGNFPVVSAQSCGDGALRDHDDVCS